METVTLKLRIRVAYWPNGTYCAYGGDGSEQMTINIHNDMLDAHEPGESVTWVVAEIPLPPAEVVGVVEG